MVSLKNINTTIVEELAEIFMREISLTYCHNSYRNSIAPFTSMQSAPVATTPNGWIGGMFQPYSESMQVCNSGRRQLEHNNPYLFFTYLDMPKLSTGFSLFEFSMVIMC